ncbi:uncharacterized protein cubi_03005 [Cryptosporidium ubiquitum]|uniref:Transmembrane protein n=1 Tax=Cryptosporidium ubiquitum TaxID=857276 RepID=A0A1J4MKW2_9CRYT|nr:uncharacterized protein cubi_03005 [Cryptosporidium ubiquitum]OII74873.1 hypothetical protein cubi_03005 [Cryptosporidium ubiquitum]
MENKYENKTMENKVHEPLENASCRLSLSNCIKPLPKDIAKFALYIVCISDFSSIIQVLYNIVSSVTVSTIFVIFSIICSLFGILGFYSITKNNNTTMKYYMIYTFVKLIIESITSFGMSIIFYIYYKTTIYDENFPTWVVFLINAIFLTLSRITFSYVAFSFYKRLEIQNYENLEKVTNKV